MKLVAMFGAVVYETRWKYWLCEMMIDRMCQTATECVRA